MIIVIEGLDGCGKATQAKILADYINEQWQLKPVPNRQVRLISFPAYENDSSTPVKLYLNGKICSKSDEINAYAASSFYAIDRYITFKQDWQKDVNDDTVIIADRYVTANQLYQAAKQSDDNMISFIDWLDDYEYNKLGLPRPDVVIMLRIPVETSQKLMLERYENKDKRDLHESNIDYLKHIYNVSTKVAKHCGWNIVDCIDENNELLSREKIAAKIHDILHKNGVMI